jgi:hypothetical protein
MQTCRRANGGSRSTEPERTKLLGKHPHPKFLVFGSMDHKSE